MMNKYSIFPAVLASLLMVACKPAAPTATTATPTEISEKLKATDVFLFNAEGELAYKGAVGEGGRSVGDKIWLKDALDALLAGKKIENASTKAVGCSIKFR